MNLCFPKMLSLGYGGRTALVLNYIMRGMRHHKKFVNDKPAYFCSARQIAEHLQGIISVRGVAKILRRCVDSKVLLVHKHTKASFANSYSFVSETLHEWARTSSMIWFNTDEAHKYGLAEAVLIHNMTYWQHRAVRCGALHDFEDVSLSAIADATGMERSGLSKAITNLIRLNVIKVDPLSQKYGKVKQYAFVNPEEFLLARYPAYVARTQELTEILEAKKATCEKVPTTCEKVLTTCEKVPTYINKGICCKFIGKVTGAPSSPFLEKNDRSKDDYSAADYSSNDSITNFSSVDDSPDDFSTDFSSVDYSPDDFSTDFSSKADYGATSFSPKYNVSPALAGLKAVTLASRIKVPGLTAPTIVNFALVEYDPTACWAGSGISLSRIAVASG